MSALAIESIEAIDAEPAGPEELADFYRVHDNVWLKE